jgi:hypothetical protein
LDWIFDADNLTLKILLSGSWSWHWRSNVLEQTTPRVDDLHVIPRIARRSLGAFQSFFEGLDRIFELGELLRWTLVTCSEKYEGRARKCEEDVARGGSGEEGESPKCDGGG